MEIQMRISIGHPWAIPFGIYRNTEIKTILQVVSQIVRNAISISNEVTLPSSIMALLPSATIPIFRCCEEIRSLVVRKFPKTILLAVRIIVTL